MGYPDGVGDCVQGPHVPWHCSTREPLERSFRTREARLGFNGSYLVVRKLEQRVSAFDALLARAAKAGISPGLCAAKLVGRWANGAPLVLHPGGEPAAFEREPRLSYEELDPLGQLCPLGAHIRRANPRESRSKHASPSDRHRLIRRGRVSGPSRDELSDAPARGLLFLALNADIGRQFEFVQARCLASSNFAGLRREADPLLGVTGNDDASPRHFTLPAQPVRRRLYELPDLVRARGGLYAFLPSLRALGYLADLAPSGTRP